MKKSLLLPAVLLIAGICFIILPSFISSGDIDLKIQPVSVIMPAAYKVYGNPDVAGGRYNLFKAVIKNTGNSEVKNLKVEYRIPKIIDEWTEVPSTSNLLPGQTAVVTCYPTFSQSITQRNTSSKEKAEIRVTYGAKGNPTEKDESFSFDMTSVNDIVFSGVADQDKLYVGDYTDNCVLYACMVSAEDPIIKHYAEQVQQRILCGETGAGVGSNGEITDKELQEKARVMEGVYNATLLSHMVYSETGTNYVRFGETTSSTEHIRLPREVVSGNTGLCIELALLHASVYKAAGLSPVIFLIPGHAFPGIKVGNSYLAIESTMIGGEGIGGRGTADQALSRGMAELKDWYANVQKGNPWYRVLEIDDLYNTGFKDMEMTPDLVQSEEVDKIISAWPTCLLTAVMPSERAPRSEERREERRGDSRPNTNTSWTSLNNGGIGCNYPASWSGVSSPLPQLPQLTSVFFSPDRVDQVELYRMPMGPTPQQAVAYIRSIITRMGENITYQQSGMVGDITRFDGRSVGSSGVLTWAAFFRMTSNGTVGLIVGSKRGADAVTTSIINSIH
jgi:hypothetical protein